MTLTARRPTKGEETRQRLLSEISDTNQRKRRFNAEIDENLYKRIRLQAVKEDTSISAITRRLWSEYLSKVTD